MDVDEPDPEYILVERAGNRPHRRGFHALRGEGQPPVEGPPPKKNSRRMVIGGIAAAAIAGLGVGSGIAVSDSDTPTTISAGRGTAAITWTPTTNTSQPFTGTIGGIPVSGVSTLTIQSSGPYKPLNPSRKPFLDEFPIFRWTGTFGGKPFRLNVSLKLASPAKYTPLHIEFAGFTVSGTYGADRVQGLPGPPRSVDPAKGNVQFSFNGTIGNSNVSGECIGPPGMAPSRQARRPSQWRSSSRSRPASTFFSSAAMKMLPAKQCGIEDPTLTKWCSDSKPRNQVSSGSAWPWTLRVRLQGGGTSSYSGNAKRRCFQRSGCTIRTHISAHLSADCHSTAGSRARRERCLRGLTYRHIRSRRRCPGRWNRPGRPRSHPVRSQ